MKTTVKHAWIIGDYNVYERFLIVKRSYLIVIDSPLYWYDNRLMMSKVK